MQNVTVCDEVKGRRGPPLNLVICQALASIVCFLTAALSHTGGRQI